MKCFLNFLEKLYAFIFIGACITIVSVSTYWAYVQPSDILSNTNSEVVVNNGSNVVESGKPMVLNRSFCVNNNNHLGTVTRSFTNHMVYQLPDTIIHTLNKELGCQEKQYIVDVPASLLTGDYEYKVHIIYRINPLKTVSYSLTTVPLRVVNPTWDRVRELIREEKK